MGYELVTAALQPQWSSQLTPRELLTLVAISNAALDYPKADIPAATWFGGWDHLSWAIDGSDFRDSPRRRKAAAQAHRRALRRLEEVGAVELLRRHTQHAPPVWRILTLQPALICG